MPTMFDGFYQIGFIARDLERAVALLTERYGIGKFRRSRASEWMESAHAWVGDTMIEVIAVGTGAPRLYADHVPDEPGAVRLHHHGFRARDAEAWAEINCKIDARGLDTPLRGAVMEGQLNYLYVDTRAELGVYSEYVYLTGAAIGIYDDVPRN
jgi:Glyoxalase/Bleomycin resistance protein/Dioxygenase superfamily